MRATGRSRSCSRQRILRWIFRPQHNYAYFDFSFSTPIDLKRAADEGNGSR